jgi:hypothetical protein
MKIYIFFAASDRAEKLAEAEGPRGVYRARKPKQPAHPPVTIPAAVLIQAGAPFLYNYPEGNHVVPSVVVL